MSQVDRFKVRRKWNPAYLTHSPPVWSRTQPNPAVAHIEHSPCVAPIIIEIPKSPKLDMLESVDIKKALHYKQNILNNQLDIKNSPIIDILINDV